MWGRWLHHSVYGNQWRRKAEHRLSLCSVFVSSHGEDSWYNIYGHHQRVHCCRCNPYSYTKFIVLLWSFGQILYLALTWSCLHKGVQWKAGLNKEFSCFKEKIKIKIVNDSMNSVLSTQGILQLFLKYSFLFDLLLAATPRKGERHFPSFLPGLTLTYPCGMQFISAIFRCIIFREAGMSQYTATSALTKSTNDRQTKEPHTVPEPLVLHLPTCPCWRRGITMTEQQIFTGTAKLRNKCPRDAAQGLCWAVPAWLCCVLLAQCFPKGLTTSLLPQIYPTSQLWGKLFTSHTDISCQKMLSFLSFSTNLLYRSTNFSASEQKEGQNTVQKTLGLFLAF